MRTQAKHQTGKQGDIALPVKRAPLTHRSHLDADLKADHCGRASEGAVYIGAVQPIPSQFEHIALLGIMSAHPGNLKGLPTTALLLLSMTHPLLRGLEFLLPLMLLVVLLLQPAKAPAALLKPV